MRRAAGLALSSLIVLTLVCAARASVRATCSDDQLTFEIYQDAKKEYRWRLKAANGNILATPGQGFSSKRGCLESVEHLKEGAASGKYKVETYQDAKKEYRWRLVASNGQTVAISSEGYARKDDCERALELIKSSAKSAKVVEVE